MRIQKKRLTKGLRKDRKDRKDKKDRKDASLRFFKKSCRFCADKIDKIDYKDVLKLKRFVTEKGKVLPGRITGNCAGHQRSVAIAIKRARHVALLPFVGE